MLWQFPVADGTEVEYNEIYGLWLSSKTLKMGVTRVAQNNNGSLAGVTVRIHKGKADYKNYGENTVYRVSEFSKEE